MYDSRFLPPCCPEHIKVKFDSTENDSLDDLKQALATGFNRTEQAKAEKLEKAASRRLDLASWLVAWERFSLAAAALGMLPLSVCNLHKCCVIEVYLLSVLVLVACILR